MIDLLIILALFLLLIAGFSFTIYLITRNRIHGTGIYDVQVVQIPQGTTLNSIDDVERLCTSQKLRLATTNDIQGIMSRVNYTYCTRGYVDNATIIPVSENAKVSGCPNPGLNAMTSSFPCVQGAARGNTPSCAEVVFCLSEETTRG